MATDYVSSIEIARKIDRLTRRISGRLHPLATAADAEGIGALGGMVLLTLAEGPPRPLLWLANEIGRDKSQVSRLVQTLERRGAIRRTPSPKDGRVTLLSLTDKGYEIVARLEALLGSVIDELLNPLDASQRAELLTILAKL